MVTFRVWTTLISDFSISCSVIDCNHMYIVITNPNQNTHGVKKVAAKNLNKGHAEKDVKSKWVAKASCC